jgi:hypothetical protein
LPVQNPTFVNKLRVAPKNALGLDAGGTHTRWAVMGASGVLHGQGEAPPLSGLQLHSAEGRAEAQATLQTIATAAGRVYAVVAGVTGFDSSQTPWLRHSTSSNTPTRSASARFLRFLSLTGLMARRVFGLANPSSVLRNDRTSFGPAGGGVTEGRSATARPPHRRPPPQGPQQHQGLHLGGGLPVLGSHRGTRDRVNGGKRAGVRHLVRVSPH